MDWIKIFVSGLALLLIGMAQCYPQFDSENPWLRPRQPTEPTISPNAGGSTPANAAPPTTQSPRYFACFHSCPATSEYNPICGSDNVNYYNENKFNCALNCGLNIRKVHKGICQT
uniref:GEO08910p1 n=2 Tax=Drosophila melanogaster TaxID=7227 RepID=Q7KYD6_DROME|eukprot:NP_612013.3 Kaz1-ORFB, isoform A [Drosophila melanogaster]